MRTSAHAPNHARIPDRPNPTTTGGGGGVPDPLDFSAFCLLHRARCTLPPAQADAVVPHYRWR